MLKNIKKRLIKLQKKHVFQPTWYSIFFNPYFISRKHLFEKIEGFSKNNIENKKILDVGCGLKPYQNLFATNNYIGIDIKDGGHNDQDKNVDKFFNGQNIPCTENQFDIAICTQVLEHVLHPNVLLKEIHRVLKKDGILFLSMPFVWDEHETPYDFRRFTSFAHKRMFKKYNFRILSLQKTTGIFGTCGQLISGFLCEEFTKLPILKNQYGYFIRRIFVLLICAPIQLFFLFLDFLFNKKGITLDYIIIAKNNEI